MKRWAGGFFVGAALCAGASLAQPPTPFLSPDAAVCLQGLRPGERERDVPALGPLELLPLYHVDVQVDPESDSVEGTVQLDQWVGADDRPVHELYLQMTPNAQEPGRVRLGAVTVNGESANVSDYEPTMVRITFPSVPPGSLIRLSAHFRAKVPPVINKPMGGFSVNTDDKDKEHTDYGAFGVSNTTSGRFFSLVGVIPHAPPLHADGTPHRGPTGTGDLASYDPANLMLNVRVPGGYEVEATGTKLAETPDPRGGMRFTYAVAAARDFPLFVSHGYQTLEEQHGAVRVFVHYAPEHAEAAEHVMYYAVGALRELEKKLGPTPFKEFRVVEAALQSGAGGMEFPGLITVSRDLLSGGAGMIAAMGIPKEEVETMKELLAATSSLEGVVENVLEFTVAHEVAHQYFAMLVGSDPIDEPAVDESLTQYTALLYLEWRHGKEGYDSMRNGQVAGSYHLYRMMGGNDGPVDRPTSSFGSGLEYAALVYGKGPLLYEAERKLVGDGPFFKAMRRYVERYRYRWATHDSFLRVLSEEAPGQSNALRELQHRWWDEAHGDEDLGSMDNMGKMMEGMGSGTMDSNTQQMANDILKAFSQ